MTPEELLELNASDIPLNECDFYKWIAKNGDTESNRLVDIRKYLLQVNVQPPIKNEELLRNLRYIHEYYYYTKYVNSEIYKRRLAGCTDPYAKNCNCSVCYPPKKPSNAQ